MTNRLYAAIDGQAPDRVPAVPKIWVDLGAALTGTPLTRVIRDPAVALRVIREAGEMCRVDAVRQFHFPPRYIEEADGRVYETDRAGQRIGEIDMNGGLSTKLYDASTFEAADPRYAGWHHYWTADEPFINSVDDARRMAVPPASEYVERGCGMRQLKEIENAPIDMTFIGDCSSATLAFCVTMRGLNRTLFDVVENPELVHAIMEKGVAIAVEKGKFNIDLGLKVLRLNDSVGNMNVISPTHWREFVFPHMKAVCDELHAYDRSVRIYCHICGNVLPIAEDLVATGLDCIGPLDPLGGMTPADVRNRVGNDVSLMGGVNTLSFVEKTPEEVAAEARRCILEAGETGGFVLGSGCVVPRSASRAALLALRETCERHGLYENGRLVH